MQLLEERIRRDGKIRPGGVLKVDGFLNHQIDVSLYREMAREWRRLFDGCGVNKILTVEASGIGLACFAGEEFGCPVVFAKKSKSKNIADDVYCSKVESFTHGSVNDVIVSREYIGKADIVLLIDDFLANGAALAGLADLVKQAGGKVVGAGIAIEKAFQPGGEKLRAAGMRIESLARVKSMTDDGQIEFC